MPVALIAAIAGLAASGVTIGETLANQPGGAPKAPAITPEQAATTRKNQEASLANAFPNFQALTGGSLSPESWITLSQLATGQGGAQGIGGASSDLLQKFLGGTTTAPFTVTAGNTPTPSASPTTGLVTGATYG